MEKNTAPVPVLVLFGPTASGKTNVLLRLFGSGGLFPRRAELVSADSMQVYRGMDIGTAKPSAEERAQLPHHLIDIRNPDEQFNAGDFVRLAAEAALDIARRGAFPVISGGTGFYLKNFILGLPQAPPSDANIRAALKRELQEKGSSALMEELARFDPVSAEKIHLNDEYRLLRAVEVLRLSGRPLSSFGISGAQASDAAPTAEAEFRSRCRFLTIGLFRPRDVLYRRINERCAAMFSQGLYDEVRRLHDMGYSPRDPGLRAIGYREFFVPDEPSNDEWRCPTNKKLTTEDTEYHEEGAHNHLSLRTTPCNSVVNFFSEHPPYRLSQDSAGVQALVAQNSRRYAKRQMTFFASLPGAQWVEAGRDDAETAEKLAQLFSNFLPFD
ncbi:MAG: tRNA (adenosine(37)-N6)-dimethylallyltransferase MiaA [Treponema sp.]|jgi:tRNA dimethylallyltransferase|nr:tRNA (adenosine(37)-N6)-dimethylallyltransferase MiaA [Treponema sp.]